jgi:H+-translocating NAD(P) transhydrogenase subunit alpha
MLRVLVASERTEGETRVAATPETVRQMRKCGLEVSVEAGAGDGSFIRDAEFEAAGAKIVKASRDAWREADVVLKVRAPTGAAFGDELEALRPGSLLIGLLSPWADLERVRSLAERDVSAIALELVPRITRAQKMDALSSQASIAGYKAVLLAAAELPKYFPLLMTAAGTVRPAKVVVLGAGVAGLQAIATARRLGAIVEASDIRPAVKEQIESLGARFIDLPEREPGSEDSGGYARQVSADFLARQQAIVADHVAQADVVVSTALVPGKRAPTLITAETVARMRPGSVIVDLAVEQGGNCELSVAGQNVRREGVLIVGHPNLPATMPADASLLYAKNVLALLEHLVKNGELAMDADDEILRGALMTHGGRVAHLGLAEQLGLVCVVDFQRGRAGREAA